MADVNITDNSIEILAALGEQLGVALEAVGLKAEGYAKRKAPVDTGSLRNSISHAVSEEESVAYIGTNVEYTTRMVSAACLVLNNRIADRLAEHLDIIGINEYCGWYTPNFDALPDTLNNSNPSKPVIITEFGADAIKGFIGDEETKGSEIYQKHVYEQQVEVLSKIEYIKGMSPWILYDFRCPRRTSSIQKYYNRKGLLDETKTYRKPAFYVLKGFYKSR